MINFILKPAFFLAGICVGCLIFLPALGLVGPILVIGGMFVLAGKAGGDRP